MSLLNYNDFLIKESFSFEYALNEGGAYGHLQHPFDDFKLTMADLKDMINTTVEGAFSPEHFVQEKCLSGSTKVQLENKGEISIKELVENRYEDNILSYNLNGSLEYKPILDWVDNGETDEWLLIETEDGNVIQVTPNHRIFANGVDMKADELKEGDTLLTVK